MRMTTAANTKTDPARHSLPAHTGRARVNNQEETRMSGLTVTPVSACPQHEWCEEHSPADGALWHDAPLGQVEVIECDLVDEADLTEPLVLGLTAHDTHMPPALTIAVGRWAGAAVLAPAGVRKLRDTLTQALALLGEDDGFDAAAAEACALVGGGR